jgi:hypothetical protein
VLGEFEKREIFNKFRSSKNAFFHSSPDLMTTMKSTTTGGHTAAYSEEANFVIKVAQNSGADQAHEVLHTRTVRGGCGTIRVGQSASGSEPGENTRAS